MKNYYQILSISEGASDEEIKAAFRKLSKKFHPDANLGNAAFEEYFKEVQEAYEILSDSKQRMVYDNKLKDYLFYLRFKKGNTNQEQYNTNGHTQHTACEPLVSRKYRIPAFSNKLTAFFAHEKSSVFAIAIILIVAIITYLSIHKTNQRQPSIVIADTSNTAQSAEPLASNFEAALEKQKVFWQQFDGNWIGRGTEVNTKLVFTIQLSCNFERSEFLIKYPTLGFAGHWELKNTDDDKADFKEVLESGLLNNMQSGRAELLVVNKNTLHYSYYFPTDQNLMAEGTLTKK